MDSELRIKNGEDEKLLWQQRRIGKSGPMGIYCVSSGTGVCVFRDKHRTICPQEIPTEQGPDNRRIKV